MILVASICITDNNFINLELEQQANVCQLVALSVN